MTRAVVVGAGVSDVAAVREAEGGVDAWEHAQRLLPAACARVADRDDRWAVLCDAAALEESERSVRLDRAIVAWSEVD